MGEPDSGVSTAQVLMLEYQCVKDEQKVRIGTRDNLLYATLAAMGVVAAAAFQTDDGAPLLLLLPPVTLILGWTYLVNDEKISAIGRYIRGHLAPRVVQATGGDGPLFGWESALADDPHRVSRKVLQLAVDLGTFCLLPLCALAMYWVQGPYLPVLLAVSALEVLALGVLAAQVVRYAQVRRR